MMKKWPVQATSLRTGSPLCTILCQLSRIYVFPMLNKRLTKSGLSSDSSLILTRRPWEVYADDLSDTGQSTPRDIRAAFRELDANTKRVFARVAINELAGFTRWLINQPGGSSRSFVDTARDGTAFLRMTRPNGPSMSIRIS